MSPKDEELEFPSLFSDEEFEEKLASAIEYRVYTPPMTEKEQLTASMTSLKEEFPRIYNRIILLWASPELDSWLHQLVTETTRKNGDKRQGFPPHILNHLLVVYNIHSHTVGKDKAAVCFIHK